MSSTDAAEDKSIVKTIHHDVDNEATSPSEGKGKDWLPTRLSRALLAVFVYIIFTYSVTPAAVSPHKAACRTISWKPDLKGVSWFAGVLLFSCLLAASCVSLRITPRSPTSEALIFAFLSVLFLIHLLTAAYASQRPELSRVSKCALGPSLCGRPLGFRPLFWRNWLAIASIALEFVQLLTLTLDVHVDVKTQRYLHYTLFDIPSVNTVFFSCCGVVLAYALFVGLFVEYDVQPTSRLAPLLYDFAGGTLYLPLVSRLLVLLVWSKDPHRTCACMVMLMMYSSTAVFVGVYRGDHAEPSSDIYFTPRQLVFERTVMAMISAVYVLKKTRAQEYDFVLVGILLGFALLLLFTDCCSCTFVGRLRGLLVLISCLSAAVGAIALKVPSMSYTIVFLSGVAGIAVLALLILLVQCSSHRLSIDPQSTVTTALLEDSSPGFNNPLFKHSSTAPYHPMSSTTLQSNTGEQMHGQDAMRTL